MKSKIGFMQGRLVDTEKKGRIQFFPGKNWIKEIHLASKNKFKLMEWTIDIENKNLNPMFNVKLSDIYNRIVKKNKIKIVSATCDFFMKAPFFKLKGIKQSKSITDLITVIKNGQILGIKLFIIPLVDQSSIDNKIQENFIIKFFNHNDFKKILNNDTKILFESDYNPEKLIQFIKKFNSKHFGLNYDTGNSASLGFNVKDEFKYFRYVKNIHIKDRIYRGKTVRLGCGSWKYKTFFKLLKKSNYNGNLILQTARSPKKEHINEININKEFVRKFMYE